MATETSGKICIEFLDIKIVIDYENYPEKFHLIERTRESKTTATVEDFGEKSND